MIKVTRFIQYRSIVHNMAFHIHIIDLVLMYADIFTVYKILIFEAC